MSCVLRASGSSFDVDRFLARSKLKPITAWRKGELRTPALKRGKNVDSGLNISVSDASLHDCQAQVADAIRFLKRYRSQIAQLREFKGVEGVVLDFAVRVKPGFAAQWTRLPVELVQLAADLELAIEVSCYD